MAEELDNQRREQIFNAAVKLVVAGTRLDLRSASREQQNEI